MRTLAPFLNTMNTQDLFTETLDHHDAKRTEEAEKGYQALINESPSEPEILRQYAIFKAENYQFEEALALIKLALIYSPNHGGAYVTLNAILGQLGRNYEATQAIIKAIQLIPFAPAARWNYALQCLKNQDWEQGWDNYKWGVVYNQRRHRTLAKPWTGQPSKGLYVWAEQGAGDVIMFSRYLSQIKKYFKVEHITFECPWSLVPLLHSVEGPDLVVAERKDGHIDVPFDHHVALLDLPGLLKTTCGFTTKPYIPVNEELDKAAKEFYKAYAKVNVGFAWHGSSKHGNDCVRSIPKEHADAFKASMSNIKLFSLQQDDEEHPNCVNLGPALTSWEHTAALINNLNLVITCDTSTAHLAGALGKPTWLLLPVAGEWRWGVDQDSTPWYPSIRIFRCKTLNGFGDLLKEVANELRNL